MLLGTNSESTNVKQSISLATGTIYVHFLMHQLSPKCIGSRRRDVQNSCLSGVPQSRTLLVQYIGDLSGWAVVHRR